MVDLISTLYQTLYASAAMLLLALIVMLVYSASPGSKRKQEAESDKTDAYLGGEEHPYDEESVGPTSFFWSVVNQSLKNVYTKAVDRFHTYSVDSWLFYMSVWLGFLIILLIILVALL